MLNKRVNIMKMFVYTYILLVLALNHVVFYAQDLQDELNQSLNVNTVIIARAYQDSIILRWGVTKPAVWQIANLYGYNIERAVLNEPNADYSKLKFEPIEGSPFIIWNEQNYATYFQTHSENDPQSEAVYFVSIMTDVFDQDTDTPPTSFSAFQDDLNSLKEGKGTLDMKFGFAMLMANKSADAANALAVRAVDKNVSNGMTYVYKMSLVGNSPIYKVKESYVEVKAEPFDSSKYNEEIFYIDGDQEVVLSWNSSKDFNSFNIDRALSKDGKYTRITQSPILKSKPIGYDGIERTGFKDDSLTNYTKYFYRVSGNSAFADEIVVGEVEVMPKDRTPPQKPYLELPDNTTQSQVALKWTMSEPTESDLKGFLIARSNNFKGPFIRINQDELGRNSREFIDTTFDTDGMNYYVIQAYDTSLNFSNSNVALATIIDTTPPIKPVILTGTIDSLGIVTITIQKNDENDLMGYRLFKANEEEHEFSVLNEAFIDSDSINQVIQTVFKDTVTLNSLTPYIFYKVTALDFHYNQSEFSDTLKVSRPDTIAPITPVFTDVIVRENEVEIHFAPSESIDVIQQTIYRTTSLSLPWDSIANFSINQNSYIDTNVKQGTIYYYSLRAKDNANLFSNYAKAVYGKPYDSGVRPPIENLKIFKENNNIVLTWEYNQFNSNTYFVIYKKDSKGNLKEYQKVDKLQFIDTSILKPSNSYAIKVFTNDGGQSKISNIVEYISE
ncbi:MAG: hypothetical protein KGZ71_11960 [Desulfobulbaceae bacterium]|nr:hypothetical protein [Desulfobulbaceae bacterium]